LNPVVIPTATSLYRLFSSSPAKQGIPGIAKNSGSRFNSSGGALTVKPRWGSSDAGLLWLGRICEEKAPHLALDIAARANVPITLAGRVYPFSYHQQYFHREIAPRLAQMRNAVFVQAPSSEHKHQLLREAKAVLITSHVDETSSLVAMEAAASGTPVVAFRRGALPEIVEDGATGFLVDGMEAAVEALRRIDQIDPLDCVQRAKVNFSSKRMADNYQRLYVEIMGASAVSFGVQITAITGSRAIAR